MDMKKCLVIFFLFIGFNLVLSAQCDFLKKKINNGTREYNVGNMGSLLFDTNDGENIFYQEEDSLFTVGYARSFLMSSYDSSGNIKVSGKLYANPNSGAFNQGPLDATDSELLYEDNCKAFNHIWLFTQEEIYDFKQLFEEGSLSINDLSEDMLSYPAYGNHYYKEQFNQPLLIDLAPFYDNNGDGIYNPLQGDHPVPLEENTAFVPYLFSFTVFNDHIFQELTWGESLNFEFHQIIYMVDDPSSEIANNLIFNRLKIINKSGETNYNVRFSLFDDTDLGNVYDDFVGCDTILNSQFIYNNGLDNENGDHIWPIKGIYYPNDKMSNFIENNFVYRHPDSPLFCGPFVNFSDVIQGVNSIIGLPYLGGDGLDSNFHQRTKYMYHGRPNTEAWSMYDQDSGIRDTRTYTGFELGDMSIDESRMFDFVDYIYYEEALDTLGVFDQLDSIIAGVSSYYKNNVLGAKEDILFDANLSTDGVLDVFPNPTDGLININVSRRNNGLLEIYDLNNRRVKNVIVDTGIQDLSIDLSNLPVGVYYLKYILDDGNIYTNKLIKE